MFTQLFRPKHANLKSIGAIEVPYFDTELEAYVLARSKPAPIEVLASGMEAATELADTHVPSARGERALTHVIGIAAVFALGLSAGLILPVLIRKIRRTNTRSQAISPRFVFKRTMADASMSEDKLHDTLYTALRIYLGTRLGIAARAVVCNDVIRRLEARGVEAPLLEQLARLFAECEIHRFGQCYTHSEGMGSKELSKLAVACVEDIDSRFAKTP